MKKTKTIIITLLLSIATICLFGCATTSGDKSGKNSSGTADKSVSHSAKQSEKGESDFDDVTATADKYNVVFNLNYDGAEPMIEKINAGSTVSAPTAPTRDGDYSFGAWYVDKNCTTLFDFNSTITKNVVLFAGWISGKISVSFNYNYVGAPAVEKVSLAKGGTVAEPDKPERNKYEFLGWFDGQTKYDFSTELQSDLTLYAHWQLTKATVTFDYNFTNAPDGYSTDVDLGKSVSAPAELPARTEYDFDGWKTKDGAAYDFTATVTEDMTLFGSWKLKTFTVIFDGNGYEAANGNATVEYGGYVTDPAIDRQNFICVWKLNGEVFNFTATAVTGNITLVATWEENIGGKVTVTYHYNYTGAPNNGVYMTDELDYGATVFKPDADPARSDGEYMFVEWCANAECTTQYQFGTGLLKSIDLYAKWYVKTVFEAEYIDLTGKAGYGFSVNYFEDGMVQKDDGTAQASNGFYLTGLYYEDAFIDFVINSDKDIDDAVLVMRIQIEYDDKTFNPDIFGIYVNGADYSLDYAEISLTTDFTRDSTSNSRNAFIDVRIDDYLELKKGQNVIRFLVTNNITHGNTRTADAPMIDCIYIYSDANLTWTPKTKNIEDK